MASMSAYVVEGVDVSGLVFYEEEVPAEHLVEVRRDV
jgi:hypothetical protein